MAYLNPKTSNDYEMLNVYEQPQKNELCTPPHIPNLYETAAESSTSIEDDTTYLSANEPIYEDPGHVKESIYEWFEQKRIFKLDKRTLRYLKIMTTWLVLCCMW